MFKQLRNAFLLLNLLIISLMMIMAFTAIYVITYANIQSEIDRELHRISGFDRRPATGQSRPGSELPIPRPDAGESPEHSVSFFVATDRQGNIAASSSLFEMDEEFYQRAVEKALSSGKDTGHFKLGGGHWAFLLSPFSNGYRITFLDVSSQQTILTRMIYTFLIVAAVMLIAIFLVSKFFADRAIIPIRAAFDKQKMFISDASHELRTPLSAITSNVDVLLSNKDDRIRDHVKWLHYIKSEAERMTGLTNDLLYLTHMDYSDMKGSHAILNLSDMVENVILTMDAVFFERSISLDYDIEPALTTVGDREQLRRVVVILLDNALKYSDQQGSVDISLKKHNHIIALSVTNTGEGIGEEHIARIFDRFYRADASRARKLGNYGLGLAIAKTIVDQHKGKIYAKSVLNKNTTFVVELPLVPASPAA